MYVNQQMNTFSQVSAINTSYSKLHGRLTLDNFHLLYRACKERDVANRGKRA